MAEIDDKLDEIIADVEAETTLIAGIGTFIAGLKQELLDALANSGVSSATLAKVTKILGTAEANKTALAEALTANVPPPVVIPPTEPTPQSP